MKNFLLSVLAVTLVITAIVVAYSANVDAGPYVLTVVSSKYTGSNDTAAFQEFASKRSCEYARGFVEGATESVVAECIPK